jgi:hypothetical protein
MAEQPFISSEERPDLTVDLDARVGDLTVRQLSEILGGTSSPAKLKELQAAKEIKEPIKEPAKEHKDIKDQKDSKDHKDPKEPKDQKDTKDHKDPKDQKDQKDQKDPKDQKDQKDNKDQKDPKDPKDHKDQKDHKDPKDTKEHKDLKDRKEGLIEKLPHDKNPPDKLPEVAQGAEGAVGAPSGLDDVIQRLTRLEQDVAGRATASPAAPERRGR